LGRHLASHRKEPAISVLYLEDGIPEASSCPSPDYIKIVEGRGPYFPVSPQAEAFAEFTLYKKILLYIIGGEISEPLGRLKPRELNSFFPYASPQRWYPIQIYKYFPLSSHIKESRVLLQNCQISRLKSVRTSLFSEVKIEMKRATATLHESCIDSANAYSEVTSSIKNVRSLVGKHGQRRSYAGFRTFGTALILAPTPDPITDVVGLALIGIGTAAERRKPPLTILEMCEESRTIFRGLSSSRHLR
jgi:hypothetical protein